MHENYHSHYAIAENYRVLTCCINVTYVIGEERDNNHLLHCIVPIQ